MAEDRAAWFREAKFGMFIHWGLYAIPAGRWKGEFIPGIGEWIMRNARIPVDEYAALAERFNPVKFDAEEWVKLAKDAGMKYMVITSKHHDGFALFRSKISDYNIVDATPFKRNVLKELSDACAKHDMRLGFYYSQSQDWHHPGGRAAGQYDSDDNCWDPKQKGDFDEYLQNLAEPQVREILTDYGPVCLIWFDTPRDMTEERADRLEELVRELQPECLINGRLRVDRAGYDYVSTGDNAIPPDASDTPWETPATMNDTWGFKTDDENWKSATDMIVKLVDIASKGGNYLLNVGPTAEGLIPQPSIERLREMGEWLKVNGESIYGSGRTPFGVEFGEPGSEKDKHKRPIYVKVLNWRCTTKPGKLYVHLLGRDGDTVELPPVDQKITGACFLADPGGAGLVVDQNEKGASISLPPDVPGKHVTVIRLDLA